MGIYNQFKTVVLLAMLTALLLFVGSMFGRGGLIFAFFFVILMNFFSYFYSDKIVLAMYRAQEVKDHNSSLYKICKELSQITKLPMPKVYIIPDRNANAFATGRNPQHAAVAATQGILDLLSYDELRGVLAHEFSHIKNRDILISTVAGMIAGVISYIGNMAMWSALFGGRDNNRGGAFQLLFLMIVTPLIATLIQLAISRSREYLADSTGASFIGDGKPLATALEKLHRDAKAHPMRHGNDATAHLFIVNPFSRKGITALFSTHPPAGERIRRLEEMKF